MSSNRLANEGQGLKDKPLIYLMIYGLQRARDLDQDSYREISRDPNAPLNPSKQFAKILREGSDLGIHTIAWCDTPNNLNRRMERTALKDFEMRAIFQMSKEDASLLLDQPNAATKLGAHRALLSDMQEGTLEKFRPFALPTLDWLVKVIK